MLLPAAMAGSKAFTATLPGLADGPIFTGNTEKVLVGDLKTSVDRLIGHSVDLTETAKALKAYSVKSTTTAEVLKAYSVKSTKTAKVLKAYSVKSTMTVKVLRAYSVKSTETVRVLRAYAVESTMSIDSVSNSRVAQVLRAKWRPLGERASAGLDSGRSTRSIVGMMKR